MKYAWTCDVLKKYCIIGSTQSKPSSTQIPIFKHTSKRIKHCENANGMQCMIIQHQINNTLPKTFTKISKIFKTPKFSKKTQKPRSNAWNAWEERDLKFIPQDWSFNRLKSWREWRLEWEESVWRERKEFLLKERSENEIWFHDEDICRNRSSMDRGAVKIYRGAVKNLLMAKVPRWIEILSRIYRPNKKFPNGSRSY